MRTMENNKDLHRLCKQNAVRRWVKKELRQHKLSKTEIVKRIDELRAEGVTALEACDLFQNVRTFGWVLYAVVQQFWNKTKRKSRCT